MSIACRLLRSTKFTVHEVALHLNLFKVLAKVAGALQLFSALDGLASSMLKYRSPHKPYLRDGPISLNFMVFILSINKWLGMCFKICTLTFVRGTPLQRYYHSTGYILCDILLYTWYNTYTKLDFAGAWSCIIECPHQNPLFHSIFSVAIVMRSSSTYQTAYSGR